VTAHRYTRAGGSAAALLLPMSVIQLVLAPASNADTGQAFPQAALGSWSHTTAGASNPDNGVRGGPVAPRGAAAAPATATSVSGRSASAKAGDGAWTATPLSPSSAWGVSAQTGSFTWSMPFRVPPAAAGPTPSVSLSYDSGSVDGETGSTNNQPSPVGEGWTLAAAGYIDRSYVTCASEHSAVSGAPDYTADLCWQKDNATASFAGHSGTIVQDENSGSWHFEADDGSTVRYVNASGDRQSDYWKVVTPDGTQYFFGRGTAGTGGPATNSRWTVPVYGNDAGDPCHAAAFASSRCDLAWRWNLDYIQDPHGNVEAFYYKSETNSYAPNLGNSGVANYTRGGVLDHIDYGMRVGAESSAPLRVTFDYSNRCVATSCPTPDDPTNFTAAKWPDVPWDNWCKDATSCANHSAPTFFSQYQLDGVRTQIVQGAATVDSWTLKHSFPNPGDGQNAALWLSQVTHTGNGATPAITLPPTVFDGVAYQNRVQNPQQPDHTIDAVPLFRKYRITSVRTESGGEIVPTYDSSPTAAQGCSSTSLPTDPSNNHQLCFQQWWTPPDAAGIPGVPEEDWFYRYVTSQVTADPTVGVTTGNGGASIDTTYYDYTAGQPSWRYSLSPLVPAGKRTWSVWAGYDKVRVRKGNPADTTQQVVSYQFFQGIDRTNPQIPTTTGQPRSVTKTVNGQTVTDAPWLAGRVWERKTLLGVNADNTDGQAISTTYTVPYTPSPSADDGNVEAHFVSDASTTTITALFNSTGTVTGTRTTSNINSYEGSSPWRLTQSLDQGDIAASGDDRCTVTTYPDADATTLLSYPLRVDVARTCALAAPSQENVQSADVISRTKYCYDKQATCVPTAGSPTKVDVLGAWDGSGTSTTAHWLTTNTEYDTLGRPTQVTDPLTRTTRTAYTPSAASPVTQVVLTNPKNWTTTTVLDPKWGVPTSVNDVNSKVTSATYDALGRREKVWLTDRPQASSSPSISYTYTIPTVTGPGTVTVSGAASVAASTLLPDGSTSTSYSLIGGLGRPRQAQGPAEGGGALVTDTHYDTAGRVDWSTAPYWTPGAVPSSVVFQPATAAQYPALTKSFFDGAGRVTSEQFWVLGVQKWATNTSYGGDRTTVIPNVSATSPHTVNGGIPTTTVTDARGRVTSLIQYVGTDPSVADAASQQATTYEYDTRGNQSKMTDPAHNVWAWQYDPAGRLRQSMDPDAGTTTFNYDDAGQLTSSTDSRTPPVTLAYQYDELGRKTDEFQGSTDGALLAHWSYDQLAGTSTQVRGQLADATRYVGSVAGSPGVAGIPGTPYTTRVDGYDDAYRPTGTAVIVPASAGPLAGTYSTKAFYNPDGSLANRTTVAGGGLPAETLHYRYTPQGQLLAVNNGATSYLARATYRHDGLLAQIVQGYGAVLSKTYQYEDGTNRLYSSLTVEGVADGDSNSPGGAYVTLANRTYAYDNAGNVTSAADLIPTDTAHAPTPNRMAGDDRQCFSYDRLQQLQQAWTSNTGDCRATGPAAGTVAGTGVAAPYWQSFSYDNATGNRLTATNHSVTGAADVTASYAYTAPAAGGATLAHAVSGVTYSNDPTHPSTYTYNGAGATTTRPGQSLTYDEEGHLAGITVGGAAAQSRVYTADGALLLQTEPTSGSTLYLGDTELHLPANTTDSNQVSGTRTYTELGQPQAERTATVSSGLQRLAFLDTDPHGTATTSIDATTGTVTHRYSDPFGSPRGTAPAAWPSTHGYLNAPNDASTGLTHLGARDYDPVLGRFLSVDPVLSPFNPQQNNGYSYAWNNPISHADASGLDPDNQGVCGGYVTGACHAGGGNNGGVAGGSGGENGGPGSGGSGAAPPPAGGGALGFSTPESFADDATHQKFGCSMLAGSCSPTYTPVNDYFFAQEQTWASTWSSADPAGYAAFLAWADKTDRYGCHHTKCAVITIGETLLLLGGLRASADSSDPFTSPTGPTFEGPLAAKAADAGVATTEQVVVRGGADLAKVTGQDQAAIQSAATRIGRPISLVGSRATGSISMSSDYDYVVTGATKENIAILRKALPSTYMGIGEPPGIDIFTGGIQPGTPYITFNPGP